MTPPSSPRLPHIGLGIHHRPGAGAAVAASGFFIVQEGQVAVVTQFGKYKNTAPAGFQWRMPYPIQNHEMVNVSKSCCARSRWAFAAVRATRCCRGLDADHRRDIVDMQFVVQYRLRADGAPDYLFKMRDPDESVRQAAETAMREIVGEADGLRALRGPYRSRRRSAESHAADPGPLQRRHPDQHGRHPERPAARAGAGRVRRRPSRRARTASARSTKARHTPTRSCRWPAARPRA